MTTNIRKTDIAIERFITKIEIHNDKSDAEELDAIAWDNLAKVSRCEAISEMLRVFYGKGENLNLLNEHKKSYRSISVYGEDDDLIDLFRAVTASVNAKYGRYLSNRELEYMAPAFFHLLDPAAKRVKLDEGTARWLARKQNWVCPLCNNRINMLAQEIEVDHDRAWCRVGDLINHSNLRAVHSECNDRKMTSYLAHTNMSDYVYII